MKQITEGSSVTLSVVCGKQNVLKRARQFDMAALTSLVVSAPAKVILHGEHAVVYGKVGLHL